jgi:hypothetical protein
MALLAIAALLASAATAYLIGYAVVASRGSFIRSKRGTWLLVALGVSLLLLPPQLTVIDVSSIVSIAGAPGMPPVPALDWPAAFGKGVYLASWGVTSLLALLAGMRIWRAGTPGWRDVGFRAYDASPASRVTSLLPLANTLPDAIDVLVLAGIASRDAERSAVDIREVGRRLTDALPPSDGALYMMVATKLPAPVAALVTGYLLEGAGRRTMTGS